MSDGRNGSRRRLWAGAAHTAAGEAGFDRAWRFDRRLLDAGSRRLVWAEAYGVTAHIGASGGFSGRRCEAQISRSARLGEAGEWP